MQTEQIIKTAEEKLIHTYNRYQIVLDKGDGVRLYDTDGKEYLDFGAGIAVFALGYNNKEYNDALKAQIDKLIHTSNYFYNEPAVNAAKALTKVSGMDRVFFTNSGTESIEGAIKLAKKYAYLKTGRTDSEIIAMHHSFHGRSMGALAVTGNKHYQEAFGPMIPGIKFANYNDIESVKQLVNDKTCAIIFETVQGEGGIYPATNEFIKGVRQLCDEKGILLILDEIQCGMGRTGTMFAFQQYGVEHFCKHKSYFFLHNRMKILFCDFIVWQPFFCPIRMRFGQIAFPQILILQNSAFQLRHFHLQSSRKNCQSHHFDQTNIFFFYMVIFRMGMIHT